MVKGPDKSVSTLRVYNYSKHQKIRIYDNAFTTWYPSNLFLFVRDSKASSIWLCYLRSCQNALIQWTLNLRKKLETWCIMWYVILYGRRHGITFNILCCLEIFFLILYNTRDGGLLNYLQYCHYSLSTYLFRCMYLYMNEN